jgi:predicted methyltransferase MtxX (methanogen marker protein 4)
MVRRTITRIIKGTISVWLMILIKKGGTKMSKLISVVEGKNKRYIFRCNVGIDEETGKLKQIYKIFSTFEEAEEFVKLIENDLSPYMGFISLKRNPIIWSKEEKAGF